MPKFNKKIQSVLNKFENLPHSLNVPVSIYNDLLEVAKELEHQLNTPYKKYECSWKNGELDCQLTYTIVAKNKADAKKCLNQIVKVDSRLIAGKDSLKITEVNTITYPFIAEHEFNFDNDI